MVIFPFTLCTCASLQTDILQSKIYRKTKCFLSSEDVLKDFADITIYMYNGYPAELKSINCNEMVKSLGGSAATDLKSLGAALLQQTLLQTKRVWGAPVLQTKGQQLQNCHLRLAPSPQEA